MTNQVSNVANGQYPGFNQTGLAQQVAYMYRDFFVYEVDITSTIAASGSVTASFTIQADSDFLWTKSAFIMTGTSIGASLLVQDTGSGRNLMTQAVPVANFFGTGSLPSSCRASAFLWLVRWST